jgi:hypothetical protein
MKRTLLLALLALTLAINTSRAAAPKGAILVEAEAFADHGGWANDQQFMDQMGSPYLLAHGLGTPVKDATTEIKVEQAGTYKMWVRTKDWVAQWNAPGQPGKFQVLVNGQPVKATFGTEGAQWHWQAGGSVALPAGRIVLALHDLTGFEGRCDAILFSADPGFTPPNELKALAAFRQAALGLPEKPRESGSYDLVIVGGGVAGATAALTAARLGLRVALVQDRAVLGGNNSSEVRMGMSGKGNLQPYPRIGDVTNELDPARRYPPGPQNTAETFEDERRLELVRNQKNVTLFLNYHVNGVEAAGKQIQAITARNTRSGERMRWTGRLFADCTGDGEVGTMAGADYSMTKEQHMGPSNLWNVMETGAAAPFPSCPWALNLADKPFPGRVLKRAEADAAQPGTRKSAAKAARAANPLGQLGQWFWESGFDWDPIKDVEQMRDWNLRAMYGAWDALKNVDKLYPTHKIVWASYITGKRESVRLVGDVVLTVEDFKNGRPFEDGCFPCTWGIDLHYPNKAYQKGFEGKEFISYATSGKYKVPYWAPYRTLYSRNIGNLFMAGRDISVTHDALGPVRVMKTTGMMGEIVGMAASICVKQNTTPRGVYEKHLGELKALMQQGCGRDSAYKGK